MNENVSSIQRQFFQIFGRIETNCPKAREELDSLNELTLLAPLALNLCRIFGKIYFEYLLYKMPQFFSLGDFRHL
jgi:hypothetical protein